MNAESKTWRAVLYGNYSAHFSSGKEHNPELHHHLFSQTYNGLLPANKDGPVLDLGCGKGEWLSWLQNQGYASLSGVDLSAEDLAVAARLGIATHQSDVIRHLQKFSGHFAIIHAKDLIEHLDKDELVLLGQTVLRALRPGGVFIASTFNAQAPLSAVTRYGDFTHEFGFTPSSMRQWLSACGFSKNVVRGIHVCPRSLRGKLRKALYRVVNSASSLLLTLRHGKDDPANLDCSPDLICVATKG
jgi:2-polyprenyl-3-methyl-5-hydroxy-6-metoxy-1,4-benzoquinol methylase